ncbi:hypothetical protein WJX75_000839 [Coccomyxa subellipsoidea]|uniref:SET domain-containing protein n=1 Tax=Coccomyxa subellipsoidea TaxID=248742 RepID=A0ABR2YN22_9CHLO
MASEAPVQAPASFEPEQGRPAKRGRIDGETIAAVNEKYNLNVPYQVDPEAAAAGAERLRKYRKHVEDLKQQQRMKPDMIAFKERKVELGTPLEVIGQVPGVAVGAKFQNKGELAIMGVHCNITGGIYFKGKNPAYSIVLAGNYADDHDAGDVIDYTGMGGQDSDGRQVTDQDWNRGNLALKLSFEQGTPIRVARGRNVEKTYDGLYRVTKCWKEAGKDDRIICRFRLVPIPGHNLLSERVITRARHTRKAFDRVQLQGGQRLPLSSAELHRLPPPSERPGLISEDISGGLETVKIPAFNNVDDTPLDPLEYIRESLIGTEAAQKRADDAKEAYCQVFCGRASAGFCAYDDQGLVAKRYANQPCFAECPASCKGRICMRNQVVTRGITLPLEVVYTGPARKWGLTCAQDIPEGAFICEYAGSVITGEEADTLDTEADHDKYLYDMSDFVRENIPDKADKGFRPPVPADLADPELLIENCLTIDARCTGNVARFMNHACSGANNVFPRPVLVEGSTGLIYKVAFFAAVFIPVGTELTYDYHWEESHFKGGCHCGSLACRAPAAQLPPPQAAQHPLPAPVAPAANAAAVKAAV